ncbi:B box and SPRY domain-containing protein [Tiliqua scincoides]|uniref:B box and SPRY domain-containing protein n=1 Tax=Tiliqua scincoides TaxID=71010 RepID=UPI003461B48F
MAQQAAAPGPADGLPPAGSPCPEHALPLSGFCCAERRPVCARCCPCPLDHRLRPLALEAAHRRVSSRGPPAGRQAGSSATGRAPGASPSSLGSAPSRQQCHRGGSGCLLFLAGLSPVSAPNRQQCHRGSAPGVAATASVGFLPLVHVAVERLWAPPLAWAQPRKPPARKPPLGTFPTGGSSTGEAAAHTLLHFRLFQAEPNKIVDECEKLQLQSGAISKYVAGVLPEKKQQVVSAASKAREVLIQRLNLVRNLCDSEEQRLLDLIHSEEERAHQNILTQQVHWTESLRKLDALRNYMVAMITATDDSSLVQAEEEIFERAEEAEGILKPQESEKLNFNPRCIQSPLVSRLWASAVLCWASGKYEVHIDEKTVSPLLVLSEDKKTLTFSPKKARVDLDSPARFNHWPNALAEESFCAGIHAWRVRVTKSGAYKLGVSYGSLPRKGAGPDARLGYNPSSWVFSRYDKEFQFSHNDRHQEVELLKCPAEIGILVDLDAGELLFYDPESGAILHAHQELFTAPVYPSFAVADHGISLLR